MGLFQNIMLISYTTSVIILILSVLHPLLFKNILRNGTILYGLPLLLGFWYLLVCPYRNRLFR